MTKKSNLVQIFTDGACKGNPGPGGWGAIMKYGDHVKELNGYSAETTNNIMELTAVIEALKSLTRPCNIILTTDSNYVKNGITKWFAQWEARGWRTAAKKPVKNKDLWIQLNDLVEQYEIAWYWVKGHSGHPGNERADALANLGLDRMLNTQ